MGSPLPCNGIIFYLSPYNLKHLPDIFSAIEKKGDLYLFTKLSTKGKTDSKNINRRVGKGTWHRSQNRDVHNHNGRRQKDSIIDKRYLMTEYTRLKCTSLQYDPLKHYVLCHLYKSPRWKNRQKMLNFSNQEPAVLQAPSPAPTESSSSALELEMEMPTVLPFKSASDGLYVEPLDMEMDPDILNTLLPNDFDIGSWFKDPSLNDCFELINTDPIQFS